MRKMKLAMLIVFCVMLFGGTVVSFVLPDREFSDVENRELAKKPKITAKRILSGEYQKEYDTYLSDQFFFRDKWVDLAVREQIALGKKDFNGVYLGKNNYLLEKYEKADFDSGQIKENETYLTYRFSVTRRNDMADMFHFPLSALNQNPPFRIFQAGNYFSQDKRH